jgi:hypothetical protein
VIDVRSYPVSVTPDFTQIEISLFSALLSINFFSFSSGHNLHNVLMMNFFVMQTNLWNFIRNESIAIQVEITSKVMRKACDKVVRERA